MLSTRNKSKSDPAEEQSIDSSKTPLPKSVMNLTGALQGINSIEVLPARSEGAKSDPAEEQSIDSGETPLPRSVLSLAGAP